MLIGIDVGGTFTDGVLFENNFVVSVVKRPTDESNLKNSLLEVLDELLKEGKGSRIERIVLSTTLVTNILATRRGERTALILLPGHGLPHQAYDLCQDIYFLKGSIDFRGRVIEAPDKKEIIQTLEEIRASGIERVAVVGKFSNRNNSHEKMIESIIRDKFPELLVSLGSEIAGKLNFPRRAVTTYYTAMTLDEWNKFADEIEQALKERDLKTEVHILKADGGTVPLEISRNKPCETVFSGPAASTMGAVALTRDNSNSVVLDIGGTTTDISLIIDGQPLYASKGARINDKYTHVNAFAVKSIPLGGDSVIGFNGEITVGPHRENVAACFGGNSPTVTDAFNCLYNLGIGEQELSTEKLQDFAGKYNLDFNDLCSTIVNVVVEQLIQTINEMFLEWENEPAYKVWEIINQRKFKLDRIIGIGAAAEAIIPVLGKRINVDYYLHNYSPVANALGACVVRPTLAVDLHVDTQNKMYTVSPGSYAGTIEKPGNFQLNDAKNLAMEYLIKLGKERGMEEYTGEFDYYLEEQFNLIRGWNRVGKLFDIGIQVSPGFIKEYKGVQI